MSEKKDGLVRALKQAIKDDGAYLVLALNGKELAAGLQGEGGKLVMMLQQAMDHDKDLTRLVKKAIALQDNPLSGLFDVLMKAMGDSDGIELKACDEDKCAACKVRDECPIRPLMDKIRKRKG